MYYRSNNGRPVILVCLFEGRYIQSCLIQRIRHIDPE